MRIQIITERELKDEDFWGWAEATIAHANALKKIDRLHGMRTADLTKKDFEDLLVLGEFSFGDDYGHTKAKTTYKIVRR